eukprot:scaffold127523_cov27-Tisochrysis_lutea.AAC.1
MPNGCRAVDLARWMLPLVGAQAPFVVCLQLWYHARNPLCTHEPLLLQSKWRVTASAEKARSAEG